MADKYLLLELLTFENLLPLLDQITGNGLTALYCGFMNSQCEERRGGFNSISPEILAAPCSTNENPLPICQTDFRSFIQFPLLYKGLLNILCTNTIIPHHKYTKM